jgi:parvulin-like peptidyl-prolyl isomerase
MTKLKTFLVLAGAAAPIALLAAAQPTPAPASTPPPAAPVSAGDLFTNAVIAKGKGVSITRSQLDEELVRLKTAFAAQGRMLPDGIERDVLESLINKQLLMDQATPADKAKGKAEFETALESIRTNSPGGSEAFEQQLQRQLSVLGLTREQWERQSIEQATLPFVLERELNIQVTDEVAKKYYDENPAQFEIPERVRAAHILIATRDMTTGAEMTPEQKEAKKKQMEDILKRARAGEDFGKLAKEYSEDPGSKDKGGEYTFPRGQMVPEFEAAAFSLGTNQISDIITTPYGYHIIKLYEKFPAKTEPFTGPNTQTVLTKPDGEHPTISDMVIRKETEKEVRPFLAKLRKQANVEILDASLKPEEAAPEPPAKPAAPAAPATPGNLKVN